MPQRYRHLAALFALSVVVILLFYGTLGNGFVWDDNFQIVRNPYLHSDHPWSTIFTTDVWGYTRPAQPGVSNYYRPLQMLTYRLTQAVAGLHARDFHLVSLLFHWLAVLAVYAVVWELTHQELTALAASLLFAVHPTHVEAVAWVSALTEVGCALFYFVAFLGFVKAHRPRAESASRWRRRAWWAASLLCFAMALLWKEMALTLPGLVAAYAFISSAEPSWKKRLLPAAVCTLPYWGIIAVYAVVRIRVLGFFSQMQHVWQLTPFEFAMNVVALMAQYWAKLAAPFHLNAFYLFNPVRSIFAPRAIIAFLFVAVAVVLIVWGLRRKPLLSFAALWVFMTLVPVMNVRGIGLNVFTERYLYIPSLGFCLVVALALAELRKALPRSGTAVAAAVLAVVVLTFTVQTVARVPAWKNDYELFTRTVDASPNSPGMHNTLAQVLRDDKHDLDGAEREYLLGLATALNQVPPDKRQAANSYVGLTGIYAARGQYQKALDTVRRGIAYDPTFPEVHVSEAIALMYLGRMDEAEPILLQAAKGAPNDEVVLNGLGLIALSRRDYPLAVRYLERAVAVVPGAGGLHNNLGRAYGEMGRYPEAMKELQRAIELVPNDSQFHTNLAVVFGKLGRLAEARTELETALRLNPNDPGARANMAVLQMREQQRAQQQAR